MSNLRSLSPARLVSALILFLLFPFMRTVSIAYAQQTISAAPASLGFSYQLGSGPPNRQNIAIKSTGPAQTYAVAVTSGSGWLQAVPGATGATPDTISVSVNPASLVAAGSYLGNVQIAVAGAANSPLNVPVTLAVSGALPLGAVLSVTPGTLRFSCQLGAQPPAAQVLSIVSAVSGLTYTAAVTAGKAWLQVESGNSGAVPSSAYVSVLTEGLAAGTYSGAIAVTAAGAANSPVAIPVSLSVGNLQTGALVTVAGTGAPGGAGDGGAAAAAQVDYVYATAVDTAGNVYVADTANQRVRKFTPGGEITTVIGTGIEGSAGLGGPGVSAQLSFPHGIAADSAGNIYVSDSGNFRVVKLSPDGTLTAFAGNGTRGYSGDGGPAVDAQLRMPRGLAADARGNVYIADSWNFRLRKVDANGSIATVAGTGANGYSGDGGPAASAALGFLEAVAVDDRTNTIYVSDPLNSVVRAIDAAGGQIRTVAGTGVQGFAGDAGPAIAAQLHFPRGLAVDSSGNLYIADSFNNRLRKVDASGNITTVAGNSVAGYAGDFLPAAQSAMYHPYGLAADRRGNLYASDLLNYMVREVLFGSSSVGSLRPASIGTGAGSRAVEAMLR
jgi:sugar lactone lactonase YvrE